MKSADFLNYVLSLGILFFVALISIALFEVIKTIRAAKTAAEEIQMLARRGQFEIERVFSFFMPVMKFFLKVRR